MSAQHHGATGAQALGQAMFCQQPPTVQAVWRFEPPDGPKRILLCDEHAAELADYERLTGVIKFCDATVED